MAVFPLETREKGHVDDYGEDEDDDDVFGDEGKDFSLKLNLTPRQWVEYCHPPILHIFFCVCYDHIFACEKKSEIPQTLTDSHSPVHLNLFDLCPSNTPLSEIGCLSHSI